MEKLTKFEVETFINIINDNLPLLSNIISKKRGIVNSLREMEMTENILTKLEFETEKMCKFIVIEKVWKEINNDSLLNPNEFMCQYVRDVIRLFSTL